MSEKIASLYVLKACLCYVPCHDAFKISWRKLTLVVCILQSISHVLL